MKIFRPFNDNVLNFIFKFRLYIFIIVLFILSLLSFKPLYSQTNDNFPRIEKINDTLCLILTYEQAQRVEIDLQLLEHYKQLAINNNENINVQIDLIDELNNHIVTLNGKITNYEEIVTNLEQTIFELNWVLSNKEREIEIANEQIATYNKIVKETEKQLKKEKRKNIFTYIGSGAVTVALIILLVVK
jgi:CHAT domain-containing protein